jgi:hypothetical protein
VLGGELEEGNLEAARTVRRLVIRRKMLRTETRAVVVEKLTKENHEGRWIGI